MKILVTGSSGTIGTRLCEKLLAEGHDVIGVDWEPNKWLPAVEKIRINADLRDPKAFANVPGEVDAIVHLAANARVYELVENPERARDNILTLWNTLEFARTRGIPRFIFASSREGYGNIKVERLKEDMVRVENCESPYTASKVGGEAFVHAYNRCYGMGTVIIRFSNVYGMYDDSVRVVPQFFRQAKAGQSLTVYGKEKCLDFTYIDDAVDGIKLILQKFDDINGETFNLAYGEGNTIVALAEMIKAELQSKSAIEMGSSRTGEVIRYIADISHAKKRLGFDPKISFKDGVKKTVAWYSEHLLSTKH